MKVVFSARAYASVLAETVEKIKTETGGLFLGAYRDGTWYIVEAIDPGPKSIFEVAYFEYDQAYTQHLIRKTANLYAAKLSLIGLWHRHPGSFDIFSSTDDGTNAKYARLNEQGATSALVNIDPRLRITMYHVARPCRYSKIKYEVGDDLFPSELMRLKSPSEFDTLMKRVLDPSASAAQADDGYHRSASFAAFLKMIAPYLQKHLCEDIVPEPQMEEQAVRDRMIDVLLDDLTFFAEEAGIEVTVLQREKYIGVAQEAIEGITRLYFAYSEENDRIVFEYGGATYLYQAGLFKELFQQAVADKQKEKESENTAARPDSDTGGSRGGLNGLLRLITNSKNGAVDDEQH